MNLGFTGTRRGMTEEQKQAFQSLLKELKPSWFHHGDCEGADDEAADLVADAGEADTVIHPPVDETHRAYNGHWTEKRVAKTHFARNRDIVDETHALVACPCDMTEQARGGTWYTVGYARKRGKPVYIIWPDGSITKERTS